MKTKGWVQFFILICVIFVSFATPHTVFAEENEIKITPNLNFPFPGYNLDGNIIVNSETGKVTNTIAATYFAALYNFALGFIALFATIMLVFAGSKYVTAGGNASKIQEAKESGVQALIGLMIGLGSYTILYLINPGLLDFSGLNTSISAVGKDDYELVYDLKYSPETPPGTTAVSDTSAASTNGAKNTAPKGTFTGELVDAETDGKCTIINIKNFPKFDIEKFGDKSIGQCLLKEYVPEIGVSKAFETKYFSNSTFLTKKIRVNNKVKGPFEKASAQIDAMTSPIVKHWVEKFKLSYKKGDHAKPTGGAFVNYKTPMTSIHEICKTKTNPTWVVTSPSGKNAARLQSRILKNLYGNHESTIRGDLHSLGIAIDLYPGFNPDFEKKQRPLFTNIPKEVVDSLRSNGFSWLGATAGRDAMHFQYYNSSCFKGLGNKYPNGNGCCIQKWGTKSKAHTKYKGCKKAGGLDKTYTECMGPSGAAGNLWVKQAVKPI